MYYGKKVRQMYWYPILTCKCIQICFLNASMTTLQKNLWCILNQSIFISRPLMYFVTDTYCHANWILNTLEVNRKQIVDSWMYFSIKKFNTLWLHSKYIFFKAQCPWNTKNTVLPDVLCNPRFLTPFSTWFTSESASIVQA